MPKEKNKTNIRSIRFNDDVAAIIEKSEGTNFNTKFENLVISCYRELGRMEERKKQLHEMEVARRASMEAMIKEKQQQIAELDKRIDENRAVVHEYESLIEGKKELSKALTQVAFMAIEYKEKLKAASN